MGVRIDGAIELAGSNYFHRSGGVKHRDKITVVDKLVAPTSPTATDVATGGSLNFNTTYNFTASAFTRWGATTTPATGNVATANDASATHVARMTLAVVSRADGYDLFLSTDANPKWVARITETQRAAGCTVTAVGTVTNTSPGAGKIDIQVVGTGLASNVNPFAANNAYVPGYAAAIDCRGYSKARVFVKLDVTDLRSLPTLVVTPFYSNQKSPDDWCQASNQTISLLTAVGQSLEQEFALTIDGSTGLIILIDTITGQGAACTIWVELA